jgi:hypothetical protein
MQESNIYAVDLWSVTQYNLVGILKVTTLSGINATWSTSGKLGTTYDSAWCDERLKTVIKITSLP